MWKVVKGFLAVNILKILALVAASATVLGVILGARQAGRSAERVDQLTRQIKGVQRAEKVRREVADDYRAGNVPGRVRKFYLPD